MISCTQPGARSGSKEPRASGMTSGGGEVAACVSSGNRGVARRATGSSLPGSRRRMSLSREVFQDTSRGLGQREAFLIYHLTDLSIQTNKANMPSVFVQLLAGLF